MKLFITPKGEIVEVIDMDRYFDSHFAFVRAMTQKEAAAFYQGHYYWKNLNSQYTVKVLKKKYIEKLGKVEA